MAGWLNVRVGIEYVQLHGIRYHRRTRQPFCLTDVYRRASWQGLPQGHLPHGWTRCAHLIEEQFEQRIGRDRTDAERDCADRGAGARIESRGGHAGIAQPAPLFRPQGQAALVVVTACIRAELFSYFMRYERSDLALHV